MSTKNKIRESKPIAASDLLGDMLASIHYAMLPQQTLLAAKQLVVDSIGCMFGGTQLIQGRKMADHVSSWAGSGKAAVAGSSRCMNPIQAGYLNAYLANLLDYDDTYFGHPGATVIPPALALAHELNLNGKQFLAAVVGGYEVGIRVADAIKPSKRRLKKVMGLSTWQVFCSAAAAAHALNLNREQMVHALSLAAMNAPVPSCRKLGIQSGRVNWLKNNYGWTVMGGMLAAMTAQQGFIGDPSIFDGPTGFWVMAGSDRYRPDAFQDRSPRKWAAQRVSLKPYASCRHLHATLDAIYALKHEQGLTWDKIKNLNVYSFFELADSYNFSPQEPFTIPFSGPHVISLALLDIPTGITWFDPKFFSDSRIKTLSNKIKFHYWPEADRLYAKVKREMISRVEVQTTGGDQLCREVRLPRGDPRNPISVEDTRDKFFTLVRPVLGTAGTERAYALLENLEDVTDCADLAEVLRPIA